MLGIIVFQLLDNFTEQIISFLSHQGAYAPILLLILEELGMPLPIQGNMVIAYTGYKVSTGAISYWIAYLISLSSILAGATLLYFLSARYGQRIIDKFGHILHLNNKVIMRVEAKFKQFGPIVIIFGRHIPGFHIPITVFSGISKVPYVTFMVSTMVSVMFWIPIYLGLGQRLGSKTVRLIHGHHIYFFVALLPYIIFLSSLLYLYLKNKNTHPKLG